VTSMHVAADQIRQLEESRLGATASASRGLLRSLLTATLDACEEHDAGRRNL